MEPGSILITAQTIAALAFTKFVESSAGDLGKKFTAESLAKMDILRKNIWGKLRGYPSVGTIEQSVESDKQIAPEQIDQIAAYLRVAMDQDQYFADEIRILAKEINAGKLFDQSNMTQHNHDQAKGWQTKVEGGTAYIGEINIQGQSN